MVEVGGSKNTTQGAFSPPSQREDPRRAQVPEAKAIKDHLVDPNIYREGPVTRPQIDL